MSSFGELVLNALILVTAVLAIGSIYFANNSFFSARRHRKNSAWKIPGMDTFQILAPNQYDEKGKAYQKPYFSRASVAIISLISCIAFVYLKRYLYF